jgi:hypothetical protein
MDRNNSLYSTSFGVPSLRYNIITTRKTVKITIEKR